MPSMHSVPWIAGGSPGATAGTDYQLNAAALWKTADLAGLKAIDTTPLVAPGNDADVYVLVRDAGFYLFLPSGTGLVDGVNVVSPTTGPGQWEKVDFSAQSSSSASVSYALQQAISPALEFTAVNKRALLWTSISNGARQTKTIQVPGAVPGVDVARAHCLGALTSGVHIAQVYVSKADEVSIELFNQSGGADTPSNTDPWIAIAERYAL